MHSLGYRLHRHPRLSETVRKVFVENTYEAEQRKLASEVLRCLALGADPLTRKPPMTLEVLEEPAVIRAFLLAVEALKELDEPTFSFGDQGPARAGQAWKSAEDDELREEFAQRLSLRSIAKAHDRSSGSIVARLVRFEAYQRS